ncbi:uncharacterized [Tachysurus ichikawai]
MLLNAFIPESNEGASSESGQSVKSRDQPVVGLTNSTGNSFAFRVDCIHSYTEPELTDALTRRTCSEIGHRAERLKIGEHLIRIRLKEREGRARNINYNGHMDQRLNSMSHELVHLSDRETEGRSALSPGFNYRLQFTGHLSIAGMNPVHEATQIAVFDTTLSRLSVEKQIRTEQKERKISKLLSLAQAGLYIVKVTAKGVTFSANP